MNLKPSEIFFLNSSAYALYTDYFTVGKLPPYLSGRLFYPDTQVSLQHD